MSGSTGVSQPNVYGTEGMPARPTCPAPATPPSHGETAVAICGFSVASKTRGPSATATIFGSSVPLSANGPGWAEVMEALNQSGDYGTLGTPTVSTHPGGRGDAVSWVDSHQNFAFGGFGWSAGAGYLNDLWTYQPTTSAPAASTPTFGPPAGNYLSQKVTISDSTPGSVIYYTTDGSTPTTGSSLYGTAITVSSTETIKAIATAGGYANSGVATATYTITASGVATTTVLSASPAQLDLGQTLTLTATVAVASGPVPTGTVSFQSGGKSLGGGSLNGSSTVTVLLTPNVGSYSITASYSGDTEYLGSTSAAKSVNVVSPDIYTYAGDGIRGATGDGGPATNAEIDSPWGLAIDSAGNLYVTDGVNNNVRKVIAATGVMETVAGNLTQGSSGDGGPATNAELNGPFGIAVDSDGNIYIADSHNSRIRRVDASTGIITTVAGNGTRSFGGDGGPATSANWTRPPGWQLTQREISTSPT